MPRWLLPIRPCTTSKTQPTYNKKETPPGVSFFAVLRNKECVREGLCPSRERGRTPPLQHIFVGADDPVSARPTALHVTLRRGDPCGRPPVLHCTPYNAFVGVTLAVAPPGHAPRPLSLRRDGRLCPPALSHYLQPLRRARCPHPAADHAPRSLQCVIARPVRKLVVAIRTPVPMAPLPKGGLARQSRDWGIFPRTPCMYP